MTDQWDGTMADVTRLVGAGALQRATALIQQRLNNAWTLVMGGQFHDILPGTATPKAFEFSWNDDVIAMNQFAGVLTSATEGIASALDTRTSGVAIRRTTTFALATGAFGTRGFRGLGGRGVGLLAMTPQIYSSAEDRRRRQR